MYYCSAKTGANCHEELSIKYMMLHPTLHNDASGRSGTVIHFEVLLVLIKVRPLKTRSRKCNDSRNCLHPLGKGAIKVFFESFQFEG